jgi:polyphosphate kinase
MMHRNLDRRVEVLVRLRDEHVVAEVGHLLDLALDPDTTAWELACDGEWHLHSGVRHLQDELILRQRRRRR